VILVYKSFDPSIVLRAGFAQDEFLDEPAGGMPGRLETGG